MPFMFCDHAGTIRIGNYTPTSAYPIARGKEAALIEARSSLGKAEAGHAGTVYAIPGWADLPSPMEAEGYFARRRLVNDFAARIGAFLQGGAP